jgi:hypothetical protein
MGDLKRVKKMAQIERIIHVERKNQNVDETGTVTGKFHTCHKQVEKNKGSLESMEYPSKICEDTSRNIGNGAYHHPNSHQIYRTNDLEKPCKSLFEVFSHDDSYCEGRKTGLS